MSTESELEAGLARPDLTLELDEAAMRRLVEQAMDWIVPHVRSLPAQPAADVSGGAALAASLLEPLPEDPASAGELLRLLFEEVVPKSFNTASPGYLAFIPGGGIFATAVADLIADSVNRFVGVWQAAPGLAQLETNVIRWFCEMIGYGPQAGGYLSTGGSLANLTAVVTARREKLPENFLRGVLYTSDQAHHSVLKAAVLAGLPPAQVRALPSDDHFRLRMDALEEQVRRDRSQGLQPFMIVAGAGTTNTGAIDDLAEAARIARRENLWLHVDAAYGGFFLLTERGRCRMRGIEGADSVTLDPHKGLFLPYGTGCLLVRELAALRRTHGLRADYLPPMQSDPDRLDFCELSPELSRAFRGLRLWLPLKLFGIGPFRHNLEEKLDLAEWAWHRLREVEEIEIVAQPQLSLLAFRLRTPGLSGEEADRLNREFLARINARRRVFLTGTVLGGRFTLRICVLSFRTHLDRMQLLMEDLRQALP